MEQNFKMVAKTFKGLEEVLATELTGLGANDIQMGNRMVSFTGDKALLYRANFALRTATRVLKPIKEFKATTADEVYEAVKAIEWENYLDTEKTFAVDSTVYSEVFRHSMFVSYRVKDAIADYFREKQGKRPNVSVKNPDLMLNIHISDTDCILSLDSSGDSLHKRGWREATVEAPLNEVLAAALIMMTGWKGECDLIDPMCGSGTIAIEAALIARNIAPGVFRQDYAFEKWPDFDADLFESIYNDDSEEREFTHKIYAYDNNPKAINSAKANIKASGTLHDINIELRDMKDFEQPAEKAVMITNPPYGERITTDDLLQLYQTIGERLKHAFVGNTAWILSYRQECFDEIGLKPTKKIPVLNGELECQFCEYEIFDGKYRAFREEGNGLDKKPEDRPAPRKRIYRHDDDERKPWKKDGFRREDDSERKPWKRDNFRREDDGERKPWKRDNDRRPTWRKDGDDRPRRSYDDRRSFGARDRRDGDRRPFETYPERKKRERREQQDNQNTERTDNNE